MVTAKRVLYSGRVQGVGFRYTALRLAQGLAVNGFVRNLPDGQVEVVVLGETAEIERFLNALNARMARFIVGHRIDDEAEQSFSSFEIRM